MTSRHDPRRHPDHDRDTSGLDAFHQPVAPLAPPPGAFEDIRSRARTRRRSRFLWTGVALAGCVVGGAVAVNAANNQSPSTVTVSSDDTPDKPAPRPAAGEEKSAPGTPGATGPATCKTADLKVTLGAGEGAAGSQYRPLRITNDAGSACYLYGFPGVSIIDGEGQQVGKPADRYGPQASGRVVLKPGQREQVTLRIVNAENYGDQCHLVDATGIRVYPPGEKHSAVVPVKGLTGCASDSVETLTVTSFGVH
jgi:hypothetical protein